MKKFFAAILISLFAAITLPAQTSKTGRITSGPDADRPTTCAPTDFYATTDTNVFYQCGPANTWVLVGAGGVTPASPPNAVQFSNPTTTALTTASSGGTALSVTPNTVSPSTLVIPFSTSIAGPNPSYDITSPTFGARGGLDTATASCNGTTSVAISGISGTLINGDGVVVEGCGPSSGLATPPAPTVVPFQSAGMTVPNSFGPTDTSGSSTYKYFVVAIDKFHGTSLDGPVTTITNGPAVLGSQTCTPASASLASNFLSITMSPSCSIEEGALFHFYNAGPSPTGALTSGMFNATSIGGGGTIVNAAGIANPGTASSTGGKFAFFRGNRMTWTPATNVFEYGICAERPGDSSYNLIGLTMPSLNNQSPDSFIFTDWGSTITVAPVTFYSTTLCSLSAPINDDLIAKIVSGAGSSTLIVSNAASQTASGKNLIRDDGVGFQAALVAAQSQCGTVLVPAGHLPPNEFGFYSLTFVPPCVGVEQLSTIDAAATIQFSGYNRWGTGTNGESQWQFSRTGAPVVDSEGATPIFYITGPAVQLNQVETDSFGGGSSVAIVFDGNRSGQDTITNSGCNSNTGSNPDYDGKCLVFLGGGEIYQDNVDTYNILGGPGQYGGNFQDTTWTPEIYFSTGSDGVPVGPWELSHINTNNRGAYAINSGSVTEGKIDEMYGQGTITPLFSDLVTTGNLSSLLTLCRLTQDTSPDAWVANWATDGHVNTANISLCGTSLASTVEAGGFPNPITGVNPTTLSAQPGNVASQPAGIAGFKGVTANPLSSSVANIGVLNLGTGVPQTGVQGADTNLLSAGTVSGAAGSTLCTDANNGATTTGCTGGGGGSSIFTSYQFGSATAITGANNYLQLAFPAIFSTTQTGAGTSGSPFVDTLGLNTQNANFVWAGPCTGGAVAPVFRSLCSQDIPNNAANTTGNAATATKWATARNLAGNSVDGSANVNFTNKVIEQGTSDAGFPNGQYLGLLGTGIMKNTTTTGVVSLAASSDVFGLWSGTCNSSTFLRGDGACATPTGSGTVSSGTPDGMGYYSGTTTIASTTPPVVNGQYTCGYFVSASTAVIPTCPQVGMAPRAVTGTTSTDTILYTDNSSDVNYQGSVAVATALPTPTTLTNPLFVTRLINNTSGSATAVTVTATTLTFQSTGSTTLTIPQGQQCLLKVDPSTTVWDDTCSDLPAVAGANVTITRGQYGPTFSAAGTVYPSGSGFAVVSGGTSWGTTLTDPLSIGHGGTNAATAANALINLFPTATRAGDIVYCGTYSSGCTSWTNLAGNNSGTQVLEENSSGVPSWVAAGGSGTVTSVIVAGTANQVTATGTCTITTTGTCTLSLPNAVTLGSSGNAGTLSLFPASGNFTTTWGSAATASNTILGFATAPTTGDLIGCVTSSTTCTLTDESILAANVVTAASNFTNGNLVQAAASNKTTSDSGIATANVVTAASAASAAKQVCTASGASKTCSYIDFPNFQTIPAANCNNTTAGAAWSIGAGGTATCRAGTNNLGGYVAITDTSSTFAQFTIAIPEDWDTGTLPSIRFQLAYPGTDGGSSHTIIPQIKVSCAAGNGSTTDDVTFNAAHSSSTITLSSATANLFFSTSNVQTNSTDMTGCSAGSLMIIQVGRATDTATSAANFYSATVTFPRLIAVQAN